MRGPWRLLDAVSGEPVVERLFVADGFLSRLVGLQFRRCLDAEDGLLLVPCRSVHTCFMRFAIDVVWLAHGGRVLAVRRGVRPWRVALAPKGTHAVLETPAGTSEVSCGQVLKIGPTAATEPLPPSMSFLESSD